MLSGEFLEVWQHAWIGSGVLIGMLAVFFAGSWAAANTISGNSTDSEEPFRGFGVVIFGLFCAGTIWLLYAEEGKAQWLMLGAIIAQSLLLGFWLGVSKSHHLTWSLLTLTIAGMSMTLVMTNPFILYAGTEGGLTDFAIDKFDRTMAVTPILSLSNSLGWEFWQSFLTGISPFAFVGGILISFPLLHRKSFSTQWPVALTVLAMVSIWLGAGALEGYMFEQAEEFDDIKTAGLLASIIALFGPIGAFFLIRSTTEPSVTEISPASPDVSSDLPSNLNVIESAVLRYIQEHGNTISVSRASAETGLSETQIQDALSSLEDRGLMATA